MSGQPGCLQCHRSWPMVCSCHWASVSLPRSGQGGREPVLKSFPGFQRHLDRGFPSAFPHSCLPDAGAFCLRLFPRGLFSWLWDMDVPARQESVSGYAQGLVEHFSLRAQSSPGISLCKPLWKPSACSSLGAVGELRSLLPKRPFSLLYFTVSPWEMGCSGSTSLRPREGHNTQLQVCSSMTVEF